MIDPPTGNEYTQPCPCGGIGEIEQRRIVELQSIIRVLPGFENMRMECPNAGQSFDDMLYRFRMNDGKIVCVRKGDVEVDDAQFSFTIKVLRIQAA